MGLENKCGVYKIVNKITGQVYIGSSKNLGHRFRQHKYLLKKGKHDNKKLQDDYNQFTDTAFEFIVIEECSNEIFKKDLEAIEQNYLNTFENKYNIAQIAGSNLGIKRDKKTRQKILENRPNRGKFGKDNFLSIPIWQYELNGLKVQKWYGFHEITRQTGFCFKGIFNAIKRNGTAYGFFWTKEDLGPKIKPKRARDKSKKHKPVGMFDKNTKKLIKVFFSRNDVYKYFNWKNPRSMSLVHTNKKSKEYIWQDISHEEYNQNIHLAFKADETGNQ